MNLSKAGQSAAVQPDRQRGAYSAPTLKCVTPEAAKQMVLRNSDVNDPEVKFLLKCIENLQNLTGS